MEPIFNAPHTAKAVEVLFFEEAEVTKNRGGQPSFATFGPLSVLFFPSYGRFALQINDWRYPLLRRLSITSGGNGSYTLPGPNGSSFSLNITKPGFGLANLDSILEGTRKLEASPDDKLVRLAKKTHTETGPKEVISENIKHAVKKVQNKVATMKTGTKYLTSTKRRIDMKSIKSKNFKKEAHSKIKKDFFSSSEKLSHDFNTRRRDNLNLHQTKTFEELRSTVNSGGLFYIPKEEIEEAILRNKDLTEALPSEKKGLIENVRERIAPHSHTEKAPIAEGMTHYQG